MRHRERRGRGWRFYCTARRRLMVYVASKPNDVVLLWEKASQSTWSFASCWLDRQHGWKLKPADTDKMFDSSEALHRILICIIAWIPNRLGFSFFFCPFSKVWQWRGSTSGRALLCAYTKQKRQLTCRKLKTSVCIIYIRSVSPRVMISGST
jgi:hypothetical protein